MSNRQQLRKFTSKITPAVVGVLFVLIAMVSLMIGNAVSNQQAIPAMYLSAYFEGEYRIGDGNWNPIVPGEHIPATRGDVTLHGRFHLQTPDGEYVGVAGAETLLAFYLNHLHLIVQEVGQPPHAMDIENKLGGADLCGVDCIGYTLTTDQPVTLLFQNPHRYGNENAVDDFLRELSIYAGSSFEKSFADQGNPQRNAGLVFTVVGVLVLGTALFSTMLHIKGSGIMWLVALCVLCAGGYFAYGAIGVSFWSHSIIHNTTIIGVCMMLYMLLSCCLMTTFLHGIWRKISIAAVTVLGVTCITAALLPLFTSVYFYDTWPWWVIVQSAVNGVLLVCMVGSFLHATRMGKACIIGAATLLIGFGLDGLGTYLGWWQGGLISKHVFLALLIIAIVLLWQVIPRNIATAERAKIMEAEQKELRAQLQENRIAIMISQIQPHFIYNTLGTIKQLCKEDPQQAAHLVHNFSLYLRGNFSELDSTVPIRFTQELEHVRRYTEIELVRFPDMTVRYEIGETDFLLPALTVQPLVENAIKHGLMGLEQGGTVTISNFETTTHYGVRVVDDGVGFDTEQQQDAKKHIGVRNVRERLQAMCDGSLTLTSQPGKGTEAVILIPKEGKDL